MPTSQGLREETLNALLRFRELNALSIVVDTNGDGVAERRLSAHQSELFQPTSNWLPMADAGWDTYEYRLFVREVP